MGNPPPSGQTARALPLPVIRRARVLDGAVPGTGVETVFYCYVHDLYDGQQTRPEKLDTWRALRRRYGSRDDSRVDRGAFLAPTA
jgi:hypothetical protein